MNAELVSEDDFLSEQVYCYSREKDKNFFAHVLYQMMDELKAIIKLVASKENIEI